MASSVPRSASKSCGYSVSLREIHFQVTDFFPEFIPNLRSGFVSGMVLHMLRRFSPVEFGIEIPPAHGVMISKVSGSLFSA